MGILVFLIGDGLVAQRKDNGFFVMVTGRGQEGCQTTINWKSEFIEKECGAILLAYRNGIPK